MSVNQAGKPPSGINWAIMAPIFAVTMMGAIAMGVVLPLLPFYATEFGASPFIVGLMVAVFALCQFFAGPVLGRYSDKYGRKTVLIISQIGMLAGLIMLAGAHALWMIFAARILEGITAGNMSVAAASAADGSTPATRKQAMGLISAAMGVGFIIGPALPALLPFESITAPIWFAAGLQACTLTATWFFFPKMQKKKSDTEGKPKAVPVKMRDILGAPSTFMILISLGAFYFVFSGFMAQFALFSEANFTLDGVALTEKNIAWFFTAMGTVNVVVQLGLMGLITKYIGEKQLAVISNAMIITAFIGFAFATSVAQLAVAILILALGNTLIRPTLMSALSLSTPNEQQGAVMGMNQSLMALMQIISPPLAGLLITHHFYQTWALAGAVFTGVSLVVTMILFARKLWPMGVVKAA